MDIRDIIARAGGVLEGEFFIALKQEPHVAGKYINIDPIFTSPKLVSGFGNRLVRNWFGKVDVLAGPAVGSIPLVYAAATAMYNNVGTVWADKQDDGSFAFERMGFSNAVKGQRVLVIEDVISTGSSTEAVCSLVRNAGGILVGASVVWNRGKVTAEMIGVPCFEALVDEPIESWEAHKHPMWGTWPLVMDVGHPNHFPDYPGPRTTLLS